MARLLPPLLVAIIFLTIIAFEVIIYHSIYTAENLFYLLINISVTPWRAIAGFLLVACLFSCIFAFALGIRKKQLIITGALLFLFSFGLVAAKEAYYKHAITIFFSGIKNGEIAYFSKYADDFHLLKGKTVLILKDLKYSSNENHQEKTRNHDCNEDNPSPDGRYNIVFNNNNCKYYIVDRRNNNTIFEIKHWVIAKDVFRWSPDSKCLAYDYAYDQDDLSKIFIADIKKGKTICLAAGVEPRWGN